VTIFPEFSDPRLAAVYDALGPERRDTDFYITLAAPAAIRSCGSTAGLASPDTPEMIFVAVRR
jgi:hypothetical protein